MVENSKNSLLAGFLSLLVPGLGQLYIGNKIKALLFFLAPLSFWSVTYIIFPNEYSWFAGLLHEYWLATIIAFIIRIYSAIDAKSSAKENTGDIPLGKIKSKNMLNKNTLLAAAFIICLIWGISTTMQTDYNIYGYDANAVYVAKDSGVVLDATDAVDDIFIATSEDNQHYYGHWGGGSDAVIEYDVHFKVNLSDIDWNITLLSPDKTKMTKEEALKEIESVISKGYYHIECDHESIDNHLKNEGAEFKKGTLSFYTTINMDTPYEPAFENIEDNVTFTLTYHFQTGPLDVGPGNNISNDTIMLKIVIPKENINTDDSDVKTDRYNTGVVKKKYE